MDQHSHPLSIPGDIKSRLKLLFLAKHALGDGRRDRFDGNHATYHHELRCTLEAIGFNVDIANRYESLLNLRHTDFVIPLLNRGGFQNSEMLAPLLLARQKIAYLGAAPIIRGLSDDKHLMKMAARHHGVPTADWAIYRRHSPVPEEPPLRSERLVVKPNASSASWGVAIVSGWAAARRHVAALHELGHDAIVEPWTPRIDVAVPVIGANGPWILPAMAYQPADAADFRSYEEKRALVDVGDDPLVLIEDKALLDRLHAHSRRLMAELWPFDYGRFEFRYDPDSGSLQFMEVNLSCNLWSKKTISRAAAAAGLSHAMLVETIVAHSMIRQGVLSAEALRLAA